MSTACQRQLCLRRIVYAIFPPAVKSLSDDLIDRKDQFTYSVHGFQTGGNMQIIDIPYAQTIGLIKREDCILSLDNDPSLHNHVQTIAAAAQFSLAELASGDYLLTLFPDLVEQVIPVLRDSRLKYRKPAASSISAHASVSEKALIKFKRHFENKGRALITIDVEVRDSQDVVTSSGHFVWYVMENAGGKE